MDLTWEVNLSLIHKYMLIWVLRNKQKKETLFLPLCEAQLHSSHLFPYPVITTSHTQSLQCSNEWCWSWGQSTEVSFWCSFLLILFCSGTDPLWATVPLGISVPPWSTSSSDLGVPSAFSHYFFPLLLCLSLSQICFPRGTTRSADGLSSVLW